MLCHIMCKHLTQLFRICCCCCSDEIYAKSIFKEDAGFVSMATVLAQAEPELQAAGKALVHVVFGLSKDWCAPGRSPYAPVLQ